MSVEQQLEAARVLIEEQQAFIDQVKSAALILTTVVVAEKEATLVAHGKELSKLNVPKTNPPKVGETILVHPQTFQMVSRVALPTIGPIVVIDEISADGKTATIESEGTRNTIYLNPNLETKAGDTVQLDASGLVVLKKATPKVMEKAHTEETNVTFDDIAGLDDAKLELMEALVLPHKYPKVFAHYNKKLPKGILLEGPPGCGKTMLAKAAATTLAQVYKEKKIDEPGFIYVKGPEVLSQWVGVAEATIRRLFRQAREHKARTGHPALLFIDEADAILGERGSGISSDMEKTIVPAFLAEMDGLDEAGAIVMLATNRANTLDPAVTRDGRVDRKVLVRRPQAAAAVDIFKLNLRTVPVEKNEDKAKLASAATSALFAADRILFSVRTQDKEVHPFIMKYAVNGAMIAGIVDKAVSSAMHRDLVEGGKPTGIRLQDLYDAIDAAQRQHARLNHKDEIEEFLALRGVSSRAEAILSA